MIRAKHSLAHNIRDGGSVWSKKVRSEGGERVAQDEIGREPWLNGCANDTAWETSSGRDKAAL